MWCSHNVMWVRQKVYQFTFACVLLLRPSVTDYFTTDIKRVYRQSLKTRTFTVVLLGTRREILKVSEHKRCTGRPKVITYFLFIPYLSDSSLSAEVIGWVRNLSEDFRSSPGEMYRMGRRGPLSRSTPPSTSASVTAESSIDSLGAEGNRQRGVGKYNSLNNSIKLKK